jgi:hypothetical protein
MSTPISPPRLTDPRPHRLLAYLGNGFLGLRVGRIPWLDGLAIVNGFWGLHPKDGLPAFAVAPYPLAGDLCVAGRWASDRPDAIRFVDQALDFATGELTSRFTVDIADVQADVEVRTFVSRTDPALVLQEVAVTCDHDAPIAVRATALTCELPGRWLGHGAIPRGQPETADAWLLWEGMGGAARCGLAMASRLADGRRVEGRPGGGARTQDAGGDRRQRVDADEERGRLSVTTRVDASAGQPIRVRTIVGLVPDHAHPRPERQAGRLVARALARGWDELVASNRGVWTELWRARPMLDAPDGWQERADASFFYLHSSVSRASLASTGVFGLAYAPDYHYYRGHVMWDIESFAFPPLVLTDPGAAAAILEFRSRTAPAARSLAALHGYAGLMYPWEADFDLGAEVVPRWSKTDKDHVSLDVALAFLLHTEITGDRLHAHEAALPVVRGVADWLLSRMERTARGFEIRSVRGPAEAVEPVDNDAWVNAAAITFLRRASAFVRWLGEKPPPSWEPIADQIVLPTEPRSGAIRNHDRHRLDESLGATPEAAAAFFPLGYRDRPEVEAATLRRALTQQVDRYVGTPMFSGLLGVFAAWQGQRRRAAELFDRGYAAFFDDPFLAPDEFPADDDRFPQASPMMANLGAFLMSLYYGLPGILPSLAEPATWPERPVTLPAGWRSIEVERLWVRGRPTRLVAAHGAVAARLQLGPPPWAPPADRITSIEGRREARAASGRDDVAAGGSAGT